MEILFKVIYDFLGNGFFLSLLPCLCMSEVFLWWAHKKTTSPWLCLLLCRAHWFLAIVCNPGRWCPNGSRQSRPPPATPIRLRPEEQAAQSDWLETSFSWSIGKDVSCAANPLSLFYKPTHSVTAGPTEGSTLLGDGLSSDDQEDMDVDLVRGVIISIAWLKNRPRFCITLVYMLHYVVCVYIWSCVFKSFHLFCCLVWTGQVHEKCSQTKRHWAVSVKWNHSPFQKASKYTTLWLSCYSSFCH